MTLQESFENIKDERIDRCKKHNLVDILNIHRQAKIKKLIKPLMSFRLRSHSLGVCFGQVKTEEKSNEITAIPELLDMLDLKGMIITIDAMGCQKKIVEKINNPDASVGVCCSHKVVAVGFNTLCYDTSVGVLKPPHE